MLHYKMLRVKGNINIVKNSFSANNNNAPKKRKRGISMADQERNYDEKRLPYSEEIADGPADYLEETSAEIAAPVRLNRGRVYDRADVETGGKGIGIAALALSILSLFVMPILFGAAGIVLGFIARRKGSEGLGNWAIGLGAISIIVGIFIVPFF